MVSGLPDWDESKWSKSTLFQLQASAHHQHILSSEGSLLKSPHDMVILLLPLETYKPAKRDRKDEEIIQSCPGHSKLAEGRAEAALGLLDIPGSRYFLPSQNVISSYQTIPIFRSSFSTHDFLNLLSVYLSLGSGLSICAQSAFSFSSTISHSEYIPLYN
ncbi:hypothetical protein P154DRAFT_106889 [Amniculicola lignicola CBS 123094]|uniref:Uncharacterized protein n=1 Tax=Amniculicola lignicola CBS 123094 TaxID=1392246 RepID=A0A6A5VVK6_9PLEO|nr:hypothetical protein P154DRAFT_106889 [Amniculicola lignicola CBS 123094]